MAVASGRRIVSLPASPLSLESFENAIKVVLALGGSTNAVIHLIAMAGRAGIDVVDAPLRRALPRSPGAGQPAPERQVPHAGLLRGRRTPRPDVPARPARRPDRLRLLAPRDAAGRDGLRRRRDPARLEPRERRRAAWRSSTARWRPTVRHQALRRVAGAAHPHGPGGRLRGLRRHERPRSTTQTLDVTPDSVLVLRNAGPLGGPGMPEWGMLPIPKKLLEAGVRDMVRISDARMSGTAYGTCVLHVAPESFVGGPLALVADGRPDHAGRPGPPPRPARLGRRARRPPFCLGCPESSPPPAATRSCSPQHVTQAHRGLRLRLPPRRRRRPRARDPLMRPLGYRRRRRGHPRPRHRPRAAAPQPRRARPRARARDRDRRPPDRPQLRRHPRRHLLQARVAEGASSAPRAETRCTRYCDAARHPVRALRQAHHRPRRAANSAALDELERRGIDERRPGPAPPLRAPRSPRSSPTPSASPRCTPPRPASSTSPPSPAPWPRDPSRSARRSRRASPVRSITRHGIDHDRLDLRGRHPHRARGRLRRPLVRPPGPGLRRRREPPDHPVPRRLREAQARRPPPRPVA